MLVCLLLAGCDADRRSVASTGPSPIVTLLDSVKLEEPDSAPLSHILAIQATADGGLLVADLASAQISEFERSGTLRRRIGRKGKGPGEFAIPGAMAVLRDTLLAAVDWQLQRVNFFDLSSGALTRSAPVGGLAYGIAWDGDTLVGALFDPVNYTSQVVLLPGVDSAIRRGTLPAPYRDSPGVRTFFAHFFVASIPGKLVTGFMASNELYVRTSGAEALAVTMPWVARRPVPADIVQRFSKQMSDSTIIGMASVLSGLFPMGAERLAVIHSDFVMSGQSEHSTSWLSVLDFQTGEACVDKPLGEDPEGSPKFAVRGDTLVRIDLRIGADGAGETWMRRQQISVEGCEWQPLHFTLLKPSAAN
jgi:hypothetical protein